jgi:4-diphosphocytidyl-2-C-methyl-D-erythritol kinase
MTGSGSAVFAQWAHTPDPDDVFVDVAQTPKGWQVKVCENLMLHPLVDWASDESLR